MRVASRIVAVGRGVELSALGVGTASLGDVFGPVPDDSASDIVHAMQETGLRYIDTAPLYGLGLAEERLGRAIAGSGSAGLTISTKVGRILDAAAPGGWRFDFTRDGIRRSLEGSLARLRRDRVDLLLLHDPDAHEAQVDGEAWPALRELRDEGVAGAIGVGMNQWEMPLRFVERLDPDVVMVAGRYTLLDQGAAALLLPACAERGIAVILAGVFNSGILIDPVDDAWFDYRPAPPSRIALARAIRDVAERHRVPLAHIALEFAFAHPAVASVVVGVGRASTLRRGLAALERPAPAAVWEELLDSGLIPADAPLPGRMR